jgi:tetratricopeptide (TPR) repeat protein
LRLFQRAIEIDPNFAMAYNQMAWMYGDLDEFELSAASAAKAYQLRERASDAEKFAISASYDRLVTGNMEKAQQNGELWARTYSRDPAPYVLLAGLPYCIAGKYEQAAEQAKKAIELDPDYAIAYYTLAAKYLMLNRLRDAAEILARASQHKLDIQELYYARHNFAFLENDKAGMAKILVESRSRLETEALTTVREAMALAYAGHWQESRAMWRHAEGLAHQAGQWERPAEWEAAEALAEAFLEM